MALQNGYVYKRLFEVFYCYNWSMEKIKAFIKKRRLTLLFVLIFIIGLGAVFIFFAYNNMNACKPGGTYSDANGVKYVVEGSIECYSK